MVQGGASVAACAVARRPVFAWLRRTSRCLAAAALLALSPIGQAHESDQYSLSLGREFADLGPYFSEIVENAVHAAVAQTNAQIDAALSGEQPAAAQALQTPDHIASMVWAELFRAIPTNELLDGTLLSEAVRERYPGLVTLHWPVPSIYDDPLLLIDLSKFVRTFFRAGTADVGGTVIGTDKVIHFINVGRLYHARYEELLSQGLNAEQAAPAAIAATAANPFYSEDGFLGIFTTGIHSNADLAADVAGFKFYRNLSEPVRIGNREWPAMLVRDGPFWRVQMRAGEQRFSAFVTPHWSEVLNPNRYLDYVALRVGAAVQRRCDAVLDLYRDRHGRKRDRADFEAIEQELATYFGETYGHEINPTQHVAVARLCFAPDGAAAPAATADTINAANATDALGRTALWWAGARRPHRRDRPAGGIRAGPGPRRSGWRDPVARSRAHRSGRGRTAAVAARQPGRCRRAVRHDAADAGGAPR